jgi:tetratricopeptide (TPR) repeat protein
VAALVQRNIDSAAYIPAGELFDLIRPAVILVSALISIWVLASARKRFPLYVAFIWAAATLFLPLVALPVYWSVILLWRRSVRSPRWRFALPLIYGLVLLTSITCYLYLDKQSADAHLARATQAKLIEDHASVVREYRRALALEDNPHTHKLLAIELAETSNLNEAVSEFRRAQEGGEPDDRIYYELGLLFERLKQNDEARIEFDKFVKTTACQTTAETRCDDARERLRAR